MLAGASGMVGGEVLARLLADPAGPQVLAPSRRPLGRESARLPSLVAKLADASADADLAARIGAAGGKPEAFICCLGTTLRAAGSQEAFLSVDRDLVLRLAAIALAAGARHAILVSSVGASAQSGNFYLRVKGETERALGEMEFSRVDLLRPGLLLGPRGESRPGESVARALAPLGNALMLGGLRRYRAIPASTVAGAAIGLLREAAPGRFVHEFDALSALAGQVPARG
jgi:uncharacterized protein YbjT (DUF2867 family)